MPKTKISEFSATPANNTDIDSINIAEGCAPSGINDAIRELMAQLKDFQTGAVGDSFNGPVGTSTAAAGAFTTLAASSTVTLSGGTANGVAYLNGSKVVTSGSALTFDGTNALTLFRTTATEANEPTIRFSNLTFAGQNAGVVKSSNGGLALDIQSPSDSTFQQRSRIYMSGGSSDSISFQASSNNGSTYGERMILTSTGLGIGTSSPDLSGASKALTVSGAVSSALEVAVGGSLKGGVIADSSAVYFSTRAAIPAVFEINGAEKMRLDSSGNLGLGVTPSAWTTFKVMQLGNFGAIGGVDSTSMNMFANTFYDGAFKYINTSSASRYRMDDGHSWFTAPSGTAGNAITFTQAATLDASGHFMIGTTSTTGSASNDKIVAGGRFRTVSGSVSTSHNTATTLFTAPTSLGAYLVTVNVDADTTVYAATYIVNTQGGSSTVATQIFKGANISVSVSGYNIQATQTSGGSATIQYSAVRIF